MLAWIFPGNPQPMKKEIIGRSMAKAIQMLDHELLVTLEISALAFNQKPSEKENLGPA
jgi:hypothetical protein